MNLHHILDQLKSFFPQIIRAKTEQMAVHSRKWPNKVIENTQGGSAGPSCGALEVMRKSIYISNTLNSGNVFNSLQASAGRYRHGE